MKPILTKQDAGLDGGQVSEKANRKLRAQRDSKRGVWFGFGMFGMIGWSVTIPALLGTALGRWLDRIHPVSFSWTLSLLIAGLSAGCLIAWHWIDKEDMNNHQNEDTKDE